MGAERYLTVLGIDPGFSSIGYAVARLEAESEIFVDVGVFHTTKVDKKRGVRASDDNVLRAREIYTKFEEILTRNNNNVVAITAETMSFPRNSSIAAKMAMCWGVIAAIAERHKLPIVQASPKEIKKVLTGDGGASKEDVAKELMRRYEGQFADFFATANRGDLEHGFDAAATVVAGLPSETLQMARHIRWSKGPG